MPKLSIFTPGYTGVIIDHNPLDGNLPQDALLTAQNATPDPRQERAGALRKRPGLARFNIISAGGVILGGIPMPVAGFGGAPTSGGGGNTGDSDDGSSYGTGDMTGAPGGTFGASGAQGGDAPAETTPPGASQFGGGSLFSGARLFVIGRQGSDDAFSDEGGAGWYVSSKGLADVANIQSATPGPPIGPYQYPPVTPFDSAWSTLSAVGFEGTPLYYAAAYGSQILGIGSTTTRTVGSGAMGLQIRSNNGGTDALLATIFASRAKGTGIDNPGTNLATVTVSSVGSGYHVGDQLTVVGGTGTAATLQVLTLTGTGVATASVIDGGNYSVLPGSPFSTTAATGTGAGATFTYTQSVAARAAITFFHFGTDGFIYVGVKDGYKGQPAALTASYGRVYRCNPTDGALVEWNMGQAGEGVGAYDAIAGSTPMLFTHVPYCGCYFDGYLYVGTFPDAINETASLRATDGSFSGVPASFTGTGHAYGAHTALCVYNGRLFLGTGVWETTPSDVGVWSKTPGGAGTWTETFQATDGTAANGAFISSMVVFNDALYVAFFLPGQLARVYKVAANAPGDPTSTSFTVTTALTPSSYWTFSLFVDDGVLYAIGVDDIGGTMKAYVTTDGASWTDKTASLPTTSSSRMRPIFFGLSQAT